MKLVGMKFSQETRREKKSSLKKIAFWKPNFIWEIWLSAEFFYLIKIMLNQKGWDDNMLSARSISLNTTPKKEEIDKLKFVENVRMLESEKGEHLADMDVTTNLVHLMPE